MGTFQPDRTGQIIVPVNPRAIRGLDAQAIADEISPIIIAAAAKVGGAPIGAPELLREDELRRRTDDVDLVANIDRHPDRLWIVAAMVPADQADEVARRRPGGQTPIEVVAPPVRLPQGRRGRG